MDDLQETLARAEEALSCSQFEDAVAAATILVEAGEPWLVDGLVRRAMALENWLEGPPDRYASASLDWRRLVEYAPVGMAYRGLARVLLQLGDRDGAFRNLVEAKRLGATPELLLGFAEYYRTSSPPDLEKAKAYYWRAATRGRAKGMLGYVEMAFELDQPLSAAGMTLAALVTMPVLALALGERRHDRF